MQHDILVSGITDVSHMVRRSIGKDPFTLTCANPETKQKKNSQRWLSESSSNKLRSQVDTGCIHVVTTKA